MSSSQFTSEDIWQLFRETDRLIKELSASQKETDEKFKETDQKFKDTDQKFKETDQKFKETDKKLDKLGELLGNIGRNQGDVAEEFFFNSLAQDTRLGNIHFDDISKNENRRRGKTEEEYDIVMTNGDAIGIIEVKYKAHENDLKKLERKMQNFKILFPVYKQYKLYGAIASFHINDNAKREALNRGFFVLQRSGDLIHTDVGEHLFVL